MRPEPLSTTYSFVMCRELEGTLDRGPGFGCWGTTDMRVRFGWGTPPESVVPRQITDRWPPTLPPHAHEAARPRRIVAYRHVRTAEECGTFLSRYFPVSAGLTITRDWLSREITATGDIPFDPAASIIGGHVVTFDGVDFEREILEFNNNFWTERWGNRGNGRMQFSYFDHRLIEAYTLHGVGYSLAGQNGQILGTPLALPSSTHGMIVHNNSDDTERYAWVFFVETRDAIHVDEMYVHPSYRRTGRGRQLWKELLNLSYLYRKPLNFWVPFSDCDAANLELLRLFFGRRGYTLRQSPVGWAGAVAALGPMPDRIPEVSFPPRPAMSLAEALQTVGLAALLSVTPVPAYPVTGKSQIVASSQVNFTADLGQAARALALELDSFRSLSTGWDSYSASAPAAAAIQNAVHLVAAADKASLIPERVEPSAMGGVGVTFRSEEMEVIVEFYNNGTAHALFSNERTEEMRTRPVRPGADDWAALMTETKEFLHGEQ
jgi:GNAT superfamily N-acetyltransferase